MTGETYDVLFDYNEYWDNNNLAPELVISNYNYPLITSEPCFGLFSFPLFSKTFCNDMVERLRFFDNWTVNRHRSYPTNDVLLSDFNSSFSVIYESMLKNIMLPAINKLYDVNFDENFIHETFIIRYNPNFQGHLDLHHDSSTFTVCVTFSHEDDYEGGGTWFPKHKTLVKSKQGEVVIHPGQLTHQHGVRPIISGERYSMVSFCKKNLI